MAEIIPLRPAARAARAAPPPPEGAQILFFLGVRYSRVEEQDEPKRRARKTRGETESGKKRSRRASEGTPPGARTTKARLPTLTKRG
ncbi:hypothetical protein [Methylocystis bryophila]|uniref:Uncharacterized protein n=1 Tax=Methylocystis bryophila TaxID=655015 RepID=A0A1W6MQJ0_9HYPH|nr:hypothetical protein [Methylocystis bryophila]ARN79749.1 hypothetical protein B1812_00220 [Methylocystis bryophila]